MTSKFDLTRYNDDGKREVLATIYEPREIAGTVKFEEYLEEVRTYLSKKIGSHLNIEEE